MYKRRSFNVMLAGMIVLCLVVVIALVYAGFAGQLNITGTSVQRTSNWDIHFENLSNITTTGSAKVLSQPSLDGTTTIEDYSVSTTSPGDTISFTFKVVNDGNYNASISSVSVGTSECTGTDSTSNTNVYGKLSYTLTYENGATVQTGDTLYAKDYSIMKVTLTYADFSDASLLPTADVSISGIGITINYQQSGSALVKDNGEVANNKVYHQGDKITLNNEDYYVIANSGAGQDYVVALKNDPLTSMAYGSNSDYDSSNVKSYIENWIINNFYNDELKEVNNYKARLINKNEYDNLDNSYNWRFDSGYSYWTMTPKTSNDGLQMWAINNDGDIYNYFYIANSNAVRPVINVYKDKITQAS